MLPIGDERSRGGPWAVVTTALVLANVAAFVLLEVGQPSLGALESFLRSWGVVPREYAAGRDLAPYIPLPYWATLLTSMFLHGGLLHLGGNMLYLWIFGDDVERRFGRARFLAFYLLSGVAAAFAHVATSPGSAVPTVGASGAISGVLGAYLVLFPRKRVRVLTVYGVSTVPAVLMLGLWILIQLASGLGSAGQAAEAGGIAYVAHVAGFVAGILLTALLGTRRRRWAAA
jgi:membrane associated rhomboid family serine protease